MQRKKQWKLEIDRTYMKEVRTTVTKDLELQIEGNGLSKLNYQKQRWGMWSINYYVCGRKRIFDRNKQDF